MSSERLENNELPFFYLTTHSPVEYSFSDEKESLDTLGLNNESTADDVRRVAISMRVKMQETGLSSKSFKALEWALEKTNDCRNPREFLWFLLDNYEFESVESMGNS
jgi:hypothetical protein